jgi:ABC-type branched-subunit amino acid transport system ATPase component/ABC-type branched-subunit amino acid transport system permease subunit
VDVVTQVGFNGVVSGLIVGLLAMGIVLVYRATRVLNFAVGNIGLIGATLLSLLVVRYHVPFWVAAPIALVVGTLFAVLVEVAVIRRLFNSPRFIVLVATIGIAELALAVASAFPSTGSTYTGYPVAVSGTWTVAGIQVTGAQLSTLVVVPIFGIALAWFLNRTTVGKTVQASSDNPDLARLSAISPKQVSTLVWAIAGLVGTVALILVAGQGLSASQIAQLGPDTLAQALVAAVIAGLRSFPRAVVAGAAIGILSSILNYNFINQPGLIDFFLFVAVLIAVWFQSRHADPDPQTYPTAPKGRVIPEYLKRVWWLRHADKFAYALIGLIALVIPLIITAPSRNLLYATILAYAICATSLTVLTGWSGLLSLGQMAFAGLGALIAAALTNGLHMDIGFSGILSFHLSLHPLPFAVSIVIATACMAIFAAIIGLSALRVRGMLLAVSTFALAIAAENFFYNMQFISNGQSGSVPFVRGNIFGLNLTSQRTYYYVVLVVLAIVLLTLNRLRKSGIGRAMIGVRDNPDVAASYTVSPRGVRLKAFALAGALAGLGGALLAGSIESVPYGQEFFLVNDSLVLVSIVVIGGLGSTGGAIIGALWVIGLPAFFPNNDLVPLLTSSVGLLVILLYFPGGFAQIGAAIRNSLIALAEKRIGPPPAKRTSGTPQLLQQHHAGVASARTADDLVLPLRAEGLSVQFGGNRALHEACVDVRPGEVVALIGANGAGKSTLMNAVGGFVGASGVVELFGQDVSHASVVHRASAGLGRTFQGAGLFPGLTVRETVQLALEARGRTALLSVALCLPSGYRTERKNQGDASELIGFLGLGRYADRYIAELSTGTRRIVELAGLLAMGARMLCLDEPTAGVAQREAEAFGPLILDLRRELDASMLVVEHDMSLLMAISDRVYCLETGTVIAQGTPDEIRNDPAVVASYLGTDERVLRSKQVEKQQEIQQARSTC